MMLAGNRISMRGPRVSALSMDGILNSGRAVLVSLGGRLLGQGIVQKRQVVASMTVVVASRTGEGRGRKQVGCGGVEGGHSRGQGFTSMILNRELTMQELLGKSTSIQAGFGAYVSLLRRCIESKSLSEGRCVHAYIVRSGYDRDRFIGNLLVQMYGNCGHLEDARAVFDRMIQRNVHSWNILIAAYVRNASPDDARTLFDEMPRRDVVSWTAMIAAYAQIGRGKEALKLFRQMQLEGVKPDKITFISILDACASMAALSEGIEIHANIVECGFQSEVGVGNALISMYGKCGNLSKARSVFNRMLERNVVSWTAMIAAYSHLGHGKSAMELYLLMQKGGIKPNKITFVAVIHACANVTNMARSKEIHASVVASGFEFDVVVGSALVNMYGKGGNLNDARNVFEKIPQRNLICWTAMMTAYGQNGHAGEALKLFQRMQLEGLKPDKIAVISILDACVSLPAIADGREIHASILDWGFGSDIFVGNALVNMYGKCGCLDDARSVFDKMSQWNLVSWNAIIAAYSQNGHIKNALEFFVQMQQQGIKPDKITFTSILSACSHVGLLDDCWHYFISMSKEYGITQTVEHYGCMIDLLSRAGQLDEVGDLIRKMPFEPDPAMWTNLLGACRIHGDAERGICAAEHAFQLDPDNSAPYVLLSNIYASTGKWDDVAKVRKMMMARGVRKKPGCSFIEISKRVHEFITGDTSHPQKEDIYSELQILSRQMEDAGYVPDTKAVLHNVREEVKEHMLCCHSEKLAIAFGLISTAAGTPLCIFKNLRVCSDCHVAIKFISKIAERKITIRDAFRFHQFEHGVCSCGDYW